jgi:hypothetical protein
MGEGITKGALSNSIYLSLCSSYMIKQSWVWQLTRSLNYLITTVFNFRFGEYDHLQYKNFSIYEEIYKF